MANRRPVRKPQQRTQQAPPPAPAAAVVVVDAPPAWTAPTPRSVSLLGSDQRAAFDRLGEISADVRRGQTSLAEHVTTARGHGVSWAVIGHALGTTGEAARQRWGSR